MCVCGGGGGGLPLLLLAGVVDYVAVMSCVMFAAVVSDKPRVQLDLQRRRAAMERKREVALKKANVELKLSDDVVTTLNEARSVRKLRQRFAMTVLLKQVRHACVS